MDVRDGFILHISDYCDRWCERCAFTAHCHLFATVAETEASLDPTLKLVVEAPPLPEDVHPIPAWLEEALESAPDLAPDEWARLQPRVPPEHRPLDERGSAYANAVYEWLEGRTMDGGEPWDVVARFPLFISSKIHRALHVWPDGTMGENDGWSDADGSAKAALVAIDESHAAWLALVERGTVTSSEASRFIADLIWLSAGLARARPKARAFVRPAFDEPDASARFLAAAKQGFEPR